MLPDCGRLYFYEPIAGFTGILYFTNSPAFQPFFGDLNPLITVFLIILLGSFLLSFLLSRGWFAIYKKEMRNGLFLSFGLGTLFALIIILVDLKVVFPENLNVSFPQSLLFYPAIGYVVEILFHLLPLAFLLFLTSRFKNIDHKIIWVCILTVSLLEPVFQTIGFVGLYPWWTVIYVGLHVFLFNVVQLSIFRRYDFISMYAFRLAYYIFWHIVWGYVRLKLLFG